MGLKLQKMVAALGKSNLNELYLYLRSFWDSPLDLVPEACCDLNINDEVETLLGDFEFIERAMYLDTLTYLPDDGLAKVDRAAMAVGLETRLPLLDISIVSYAWQLPIALKIRENQTKWCLKELLRTYLPPELIERPKVGFTVPISEWLTGPLREWAQAILLDGAGNQRDGLNGAEITRIWRAHQEKTRDHGLVLWAIINFREWHKQFESD